MEHSRVKIIDVPISAVNLNETINIIYDDFENNKGNYICVSNVHTTVMAHDNPNYYEVQEKSLLSVPDGKPLSIIGKRKFHNMSRVSGLELMEAVFNEDKIQKKRHYFYGNTRENLEKFIASVREKYPWVEIAGYEPSIFRDLTIEEDIELQNRIDKSKTDFLWVALGAPRQEIFCYNHKNKINAIMIGVGGVFNIVAGIVPNAPKWMQKMCLEWFYRLLKEPKRLFKRYAVTNTRFLYIHLTRRKRKC